MFVYVTKEAKKSKNKPTIFISSESKKKIRDLCKNFNLNFIQRPNKLSSHTAEKQKLLYTVQTLFLKIQD